MSAWNHTLNIADVFHNDELTLAQKTVTIVKRIEASTWYAKAADESWRGLPELLEELTDAAEEGDVGWWDAAWDAFYDFTDAERIWVVTQ